MPRRKLLSGNYEPKKEAVHDSDKEMREKVEAFEVAALQKLGGSIAFVRGRKLIDEGDMQNAP